MSSAAKTVTVPVTIAAGQYVLLACADDTNVVKEGAETHNCAASPNRVTVLP